MIIGTGMEETLASLVRDQYLDGQDGPLSKSTGAHMTQQEIPA